LNEWTKETSPLSMAIPSPSEHRRKWFFARTTPVKCADHCPCGDDDFHPRSHRGRKIVEQCVGARCAENRLRLPPARWSVLELRGAIFQDFPFLPQSDLLSPGKLPNSGFDLSCCHRSNSNQTQQARSTPIHTLQYPFNCLALFFVGDTKRPMRLFDVVRGHALRIAMPPRNISPYWQRFVGSASRTSSAGRGYRPAKRFGGFFGGASGKPTPAHGARPIFPTPC